MSFSPSLLKILGTNISHALIDTTRPSEQRLFQAILVHWFMYPNTMFEKICWLAGFDPDIITDRYKRLQDTGQVTFSKTQKTWVEYRKLYKDYRGANCSSERKIIMERIRKLKF